MQDNLVHGSPAQTVREPSCLVCVPCPLGFIHIDEYIAFFSPGGNLVTVCGALALVERTPWR